MAYTLHSPERVHTLRHAPSWLLLACGAGAVNGFAFLQCKQYVTHLTGNATRTGLTWPDLGSAVEYGVILFSFIAGAMASVPALQGRVLKGRQPLWATPLLAVVLILVGVAVAGHFEVFGAFGEDTATPPVVLLSLLAFVMGLQNAAVATTTGLAVRTTHLTGPATDFGIHMGMACFAAGEERRVALKGAALRGGKIVAFTAGAALILPLAAELDFLALLAPAGFVLTAAALSFVPAWSPSDLQDSDAEDSPPPETSAARDLLGARPGDGTNGSRRAGPTVPPLAHGGTQSTSYRPA